MCVVFAYTIKSSEIRIANTENSTIPFRCWSSVMMYYICSLSISRQFDVSNKRADGSNWWSPGYVQTTVCCVGAMCKYWSCQKRHLCYYATSDIDYGDSAYLGNKVTFYPLLPLTSQVTVSQLPWLLALRVYALNSYSTIVNRWSGDKIRIAD
jgi:hypothetical protein